MSKIFSKETESLSFIKYKLQSYVSDYKMTERLDSNGFQLFLEDMIEDKKIEISIYCAKERQYMLIIKVKLKGLETAAFEDTLKLGAKPNDEILIYILTFLSKVGIVDHFFRSHFASLTNEFKDHSAILCLYGNKMSFSWTHEDIIFLVDNKKIDPLPPDEVSTDFLTESILNYFKVKRGSVNNVQTLDLLFTNETAKFVHVMQNTDLSVTESQNNYLYFIIEQKNKSDTYLRKKDTTDNGNYLVLPSNKLSAAFFDLLNAPNGAIHNSRNLVLPKEVSASSRSVD